MHGACPAQLNSPSWAGSAASGSAACPAASPAPLACCSARGNNEVNTQVRASATSAIVGMLAAARLLSLGAAPSTRTTARTNTQTARAALRGGSSMSAPCAPPSSRGPWLSCCCAEAGSWRGGADAARGCRWLLLGCWAAGCSAAPLVAVPLVAALLAALLSCCRLPHRQRGLAAGARMHVNVTRSTTWYRSHPTWRRASVLVKPELPGAGRCHASGQRNVLRATGRCGRGTLQQVDVCPRLPRQHHRRPASPWT